jgi:hypothetical protein
MNTELEKSWKELEQSTREFIALLNEGAHIDAHEQVNGEWSKAQVLEHLLASEGGTLGYIEKKSSGGWDQLEETGAEQETNGAAIVNRLNSNERYKAPEVLPQPTNEISMEELLKRWTSLRERWNVLLSAIASNHNRKLVFRQPAAGMLNILQTLAFMNAHLRHHFMQIERINKS